jgi:DNA-binding response OmpR family regulator
MGQRYNNFELQTTNRKRILFVNDDADTIAVIKTGLTRHGFEVDAFVDPKLALQNFKAGKYDLLLLDVIMKGTDGFELYDNMRKIDNNIQICFISASNTYERYKRTYPDVRNECFIEKPITIKKLADTIESILGN